MKVKQHLLITALVFAFTTQSWAASVGTVKGQKAIINLEGDSTSEGEEFFLINPTTRKRAAIIRIKQIKGSKALADVLKGRAVPGYTLQAKAMTPGSMSADVPAEAGATAGATDESTPRDMQYLRTIKDSYGIMGAYIMNSMTADISFKDNFNIVTKSSASMSGTGFGVGGFYDYAFASSFVGRGYAGIEQFNVEGSAPLAACSGTTSCDAKINYLSMYGLVKWYALQDKYRVWLGGGMGYLLALSKSSTALNQAQISTNQVYTFAVGMDVQMSRKNYLPVSLEYNMFPASSSVSASMILLKAGWAWNL